ATLIEGLLLPLAAALLELVGAALIAEILILVLVFILGVVLVVLLPNRAALGLGADIAIASAAFHDRRRRRRRRRRSVLTLPALLAVAVEVFRRLTLALVFVFILVLVAAIAIAGRSELLFGLVTGAALHKRWRQFRSWRTPVFLAATAVAVEVLRRLTLVLVAILVLAAVAEILIVTVETALLLEAFRILLGDRRQPFGALAPTLRHVALEGVMQLRLRLEVL